MAAAAADTLSPSLRVGLVIAPTDQSVESRFRLVVAEHPHPGPGSEAAGRAALELAAAIPADDVLLVLLSGGA